METLIKWLENRIEVCLEDKDLQREHWAFCQVLRKTRDLGLTWISVTERLPEDNQKVMVSCEHGVTMAEFREFDNGNVLWLAVVNIGTYEDSSWAKSVTHRKPIEQAPHAV